MDASEMPDAYVRFIDSMKIQPPLIMTPRRWDSTPRAIMGPLWLLSTPNF